MYIIPKTWTVPANQWHKLASDRDVIALSKAPVYKGGTSWVMESTGEEA